MQREMIKNVMKRVKKAKRGKEKRQNGEKKNRMKGLRSPEG